jgi:molecular chaperone GrpE
MSKKKEKNQPTKKIEPEVNKPVEKADTPVQKEPTVEELLNHKIEELNAYIVEKDKRIIELETQIQLINNEYVNKIKEKTEQANVQLKQKIDELNLKAISELDNIKKYGLEKQVLPLIETISQFEMALSYKPTDEKIVAYQSGFVMFLNMFKNILTDLNINEINANVGDEFNPEFMECVEFVANNELKNNQVAKIVTKGYKLYDRMIKTVTVKVVKN